MDDNSAHSSGPPDDTEPDEPEFDFGEPSYYSEHSRTPVRMRGEQPGECPRTMVRYEPPADPNSPPSDVTITPWDRIVRRSGPGPGWNPATQEAKFPRNSRAIEIGGDITAGMSHEEAEREVQKVRAAIQEAWTQLKGKSSRFHYRWDNHLKARILTPSDSRYHWHPDYPAWGQDDVTALVLQDYLGGEIARVCVRTKLQDVKKARSLADPAPDTRQDAYYVSVLPHHNICIDLFRHQFIQRTKQLDLLGKQTEITVANTLEPDPETTNLTKLVEHTWQVLGRLSRRAHEPSFEPSVLGVRNYILNTPDPQADKKGQPGSDMAMRYQLLSKAVAQLIGPPPEHRESDSNVRVKEEDRPKHYGITPKAGSPIVERGDYWSGKPAAQRPETNYKIAKKPILVERPGPGQEPPGSDKPRHSR